MLQGIGERVTALFILGAGHIGGGESVIALFNLSAPSHLRHIIQGPCPRKLKWLCCSHIGSHWVIMPQKSAIAIHNT